MREAEEATARLTEAQAARTAKLDGGPPRVDTVFREGDQAMLRTKKPIDAKYTQV